MVKKLMPRTHKVDEKIWSQSREWARKIIQREMLELDLTYGDLAKLLNEAGIEENERNLRNKVARGEFSASFLLMCMKAMGARTWLDASDAFKAALIETVKFRRADQEMK